MKKRSKTYTVFQKISSALMILALLWLTISLPFVFESQQELARQNTMASAQSPVDNTEEEQSAPLDNTTEEKPPGTANSFSEEYHHNSNRSVYLFSLISQFHKYGKTGTYIAFHGELLSPPPEI